jgi:hypothetical protein
MPLYRDWWFVSLNLVLKFNRIKKSSTYSSAGIVANPCRTKPSAAFHTLKVITLRSKIKLTIAMVTKKIFGRSKVEQVPEPGLL